MRAGTPRRRPRRERLWAACGERSQAGYFLLALSLLLGACAYERINNPMKFRACLQPCPEAADLAVKLAGHVDNLVGARSYLAPQGLKQAAKYIKTELGGVPGGRLDVYSY